MKIIDLFVKITNGEEVPRIIKYHNKTYIYNDKTQEYEHYNMLKNEWESYSMSSLNEEVEIIEDTPKENKKIEKPILDTDNDVNGSYDIVIINDIKYEINKVNRYILGKICEIIDKINTD